MPARHVRLQGADGIREEVDMEETLFEVGGMTCSSCVRHIQAAVGPLPGVASVDVRLAEGRVLVRHEPGVEAGSLIEAIRSAGYPKVHPVRDM